jgi:hypothetical protein
MNELFFLDEGSEVMTEERRAHPSIEHKSLSFLILQMVTTTEK